MKRQLLIPKRLIKRQGVQKELVSRMLEQISLDALAVDMYRRSIGKGKLYEFLVGLECKCSFIDHVCTTPLQTQALKK